MPKKILIVDDEPALISMLSLRLEAAGYEVLSASDGQDGLEAAKSVKPDLIILDVLMPKMDGYEVCRLLKFDESYSSIPIILLTAKSQDVDKSIGKDVGADDYVTKPFDSAKLLEKIRALLK